jgi:hypothetical protein
LIKIYNKRSKIVCLQDQLLIHGDKWAGCYSPSLLTKNIPLLNKLKKIIYRSSKYLAKKGFWGYYSYDVIIKDDNKLFLCEANMRKIGSFYPNIFVNRVMKYNHFKNQNYAYVASDYTNPDLWKGASFIEVKKKLEHLLWPIQKRNKGLLIYNTGALKEGGRFDFIAISKSVTDAKKLLAKATHILDCKI